MVLERFCERVLSEVEKLCPEATTSAVHRAALKSDGAPHTALTNIFTGRPARGIVNRIMKELGPISTAAPAFYFFAVRWR